ncbi:HAMP domain-containing protein, partial [Candidatus Dependentiae bacterium]|nr:HAMP domain-containing protein [Candidatus Dependentiae bacterium]
YIIAARLQSVVSRPVLKLAVVMRRIGETSNYSLRLDEERSDELGTLYKGFNAMIEQIQHRETALNEAKNELKNLNEKLEMKIEERTVKLKEANQELNQALDTLKKTQKHLILSEKMAALGNLVAGIAHEINTPVGVGVTAASHLETKTTELCNKFKNNIMKKSDLEKYLNVAEETNHIILSNLSRAAELIQSFKKIAVGQSSEEKRVFKLKEYIDSMILSLRPKLKHTKHSVIVNCDESIEIDSYPGAFSQIITNFIMNSLMHGFDGIDNGTIKFDVEMYHDHLIFRYSDNGKGIPHEYMNKIFNPFFTTKQGQGGSGLGLHILYNIIIQTLRGDITCESVEGEGVNFIIIIPKTVGREKNL